MMDDFLIQILVYIFSTPQPSALEIELTSSPKSIPPSSTLTFGRTFTDHMLCIPWSSETGWGTPKISPYGPLHLDPSSTVLHYAPCLFEGMKAYKDDKGIARLFRPDKVSFSYIYIR